MFKILSEPKPSLIQMKSSSTRRVHLFYISIILIAFFLVQSFMQFKEIPKLSIREGSEISKLPSIPGSIEIARAAQDLFCKEKHPIKLDNVVKINTSMLYAKGNVHTKNVLMTVVAKDDVVSKSSIRHNKWETKEVSAAVEKMDEAKAKGIKDPVFPTLARISVIFQ